MSFEPVETPYDVYWLPVWRRHPHQSVVLGDAAALGLEQCAISVQFTVDLGGLCVGFNFGS